MKNADKLLKNQIDLGGETRQIISGIAEHYEPEAIVNKKVICVVNLKPVKLRGEMSEGMILSAKDNKGNLVLTSRSEEHTSELQSRGHLVCRLLLEKKNKLTIKKLL